MTAFPSLRAAQALSAYGSADDIFGAAPAGIPGNAQGGTDFGNLLENSLNSAIGQGQSAESDAVSAIKGQGDLTQVVTAVSRAELTLQTTVAVRDRVLQAYQDIIKMSI